MTKIDETKIPSALIERVERLYGYYINITGRDEVAIAWNAMNAYGENPTDEQIEDEIFIYIN